MVKKQKSISTNEKVEPEVLGSIEPPKLAPRYWCECCKFSAKNQSGYRNHLYSNRHYRNWSKQASLDNGAEISNEKLKDTMDILFNNSSISNDELDLGVASNEIIHLLDDSSDICSKPSYGTEPELVVTELEETEFETGAEYGSESGSEYYGSENDYRYETGSDEEYDYSNNEEDDLPLFGTGLFYTDDSSEPVYNINSRLLKGKEVCDGMPEPVFMATAFVLGMLAERCFSHFVRNLCTC